MSEFLYGKPGAEEMQFSPEAVYEANEWDLLDNPEEPFEIEEWTALPLCEFMPSPKAIIEWVLECTAEDDVSEGAWDHLDGLEKNPDVLAAFESARTVLGSKITGWSQANKLVRTLKVTWDENCEPLLDGEPMYVKRVPR